MKIKIPIQSGMDIVEMTDWLNENCDSFVDYRVVEIDWDVERTDFDIWFEFEVEFDDESDATLFLLRWS